MHLLLLLAAIAHADPLFSRVTLVDGQTLVGLVTELPDGSVTIVISGGNLIHLPAGSVRSVEPSESAPVALPRSNAPPRTLPPVATATPTEAAAPAAVEPSEPVAEPPAAEGAAPTPDGPDGAGSEGTPAAIAPESPAEAPPSSSPDAPSAPDPASAEPPSTTPVEATASPVTPVPLPGDRPSDTPPEEWPSDPNRVGYFYSPSAFTLDQGRGYVSQKELAFTAVAFGITDFWDIQVGTVVPLLFTEARVGVVGTKFAFKVAKGLRVGFGTQAFFVADVFGAVPFGVVSVGNEDRHLSINAGALLPDGNPAVPLVTLSGNYRLGPRSALITENWIVVEDEFAAGVLIVPTAGVRLFGPQFAVDLGAGVFAVEGQVIPLPWVGFTWNWGINGKPPTKAD